jgi:hypothetical protein
MAKRKFLRLVHVQTLEQQLSVRIGSLPKFHLAGTKFCEPHDVVFEKILLKAVASIIVISLYSNKRSWIVAFCVVFCDFHGRNFMTVQCSERSIHNSSKGCVTLCCYDFDFRTVEIHLCAMALIPDFVRVIPSQ